MTGESICKRVGTITVSSTSDCCPSQEPLAQDLCPITRSGCGCMLSRRVFVGTCTQPNPRISDGHKKGQAQTRPDMITRGCQCLSVFCKGRRRCPLHRGPLIQGVGVECFFFVLRLDADEEGGRRWSGAAPRAKVPIGGVGGL